MEQQLLNDKIFKRIKEHSLPTKEPDANTPLSVLFRRHILLLECVLDVENDLQISLDDVAIEHLLDTGTVADFMDYISTASVINDTTKKGN